jgi:hypothetical protein
MIKLIQLLNFNGYKINLVYLIGGIIVNAIVLLILCGSVIGLLDWIKERRGL